MDTRGNEPRDFAEVKDRLEEIVGQVRNKELSLEKSLDLYEEAIRLGNYALDFISEPDYSDEAVALDAGLAGDVVQEQTMTQSDANDDSLSPEKTEQFAPVEQVISATEN